MRGNPTKRQTAVLEFVRNFISVHQHSPSLEEICAGVGRTSLATIHKHVRGLAEKGLITYRPGHSRTIRPSDGCPFCGREFGEEVAKSA